MELLPFAEQKIHHDAVSGLETVQLKQGSFDELMSCLSIRFKETNAKAECKWLKHVPPDCGSPSSSETPILLAFLLPVQPRHCPCMMAWVEWELEGYPYIYLPVRIYLFIHLSIYPSVRPCIHLYLYNLLYINLPPCCISKYILFIYNIYIRIHNMCTMLQLIKFRWNWNIVILNV